MAKEEHKALRGVLGGLSNMVAITTTSPLDVLKIRLQTQGELTKTGSKVYTGLLSGAVTIVKQEGVRGLYKGITVSWLREITFSSTRIGLYEPIRDLLTRDIPAGQPIPLSQKILSGLISGALAAAIFNPTDVLKIRFQADRSTHISQARYKGIIHAFSRIAKEEGVFRGLYKGVTTTMTRAALLTSSQFASYDHAKHTLITKFEFNDNIFTHFCASFFAGFVTSLVTNPVDVVRTRIMNERGNKKYSNPFATSYKIVASEGVLGLYKGFVPSYLRLGTATVICFTIFEQLRILAGISTI